MDFNLKSEGDNQPQAVATLQEKETSSPDTNDDPANRAKDLLALHHSMTNGINFEITNELALECVEDILEHWLPDGEQRGKQYVALNPTRDDGNVGSFTIRIGDGVWGDFAIGDAGGDLISLVAYLEGGISQTNAAVSILKFIAGLNSDESAAIVKRNVKRKTKHKEEKFTPIIPVPNDAPPCRITFGQMLGKPTASWTYRNADGQVMLYVNRFDYVDPKDGERKKTYRPVTFCQGESGLKTWMLMSPPTPRPAYGLDQLSARLEAPVLFAEGEKSADAAQRLFPNFVAVTTMHGAESPEKTDFTPFAGRKIYIAPDNDNAGIAYKDKLIQLLRAAGAEVVATMRLEMLTRTGSPVPEKYDLADAEADGWSVDDFAKLGESLWEPVLPEDPTPPAPTTPAPAQRDAPAVPAKKKTQLDYAVDFANTYHGGHVAFFNNQFLAYSGGCWKPLNPDVSIKKPILMAIGAEASASKVNGVYELVKIQYASEAERFERNSPLICLNNKTLNPLTGELLPHSVEHYLTNKVDIDFDAKADCPLWLQTLLEIFFPDLDRDKKIQLLQEYIGYCLIPDTRMHKFLWMVGAGGNGKSLILALITALIGKVNISYAPMERLQEKFVRAELQGKLANICSEMSAQATVPEGYLKQITAGDIIEAERKNERPFSFKPYARLIGATNVLPRLLDHSDGFFRRAMILRFNRQFLKDEIDTQREAKLMAELPGILNWAVAGLQALLKRGYFEIPKSSEAEVQRYRVNSDPVRQFAEEFLTATDNKDRWVASGALYDRYRTWSSENGYKTLASNQFAERLSGVGFSKARDNTGRYWKANYDDSSFKHISPVESVPKASRYVV